MKNSTDAWTDEKIQAPRISILFKFMNNIPNLLRILGTSAVLIAMYSFLMKGWESNDDLFRYMLMLGHTAFLAFVGLVSGHWLKESKGARLLLTLSLISIPINFAILGGMILSQASVITPANYPQYVTWTVDNLNTALLTTGGALLVLIPICYLGFRVLTRDMFKRLSFLFLLSSCSLLLPVRDPYLIGSLVLALTAIILFYSRLVSHQKISAKTNEGFTALFLQLIPLSILMGRSLWLYETDLFLISALAVTIFILIRQVSTILNSDSRIKNMLNFLSIIPAGLITFTLAETLLSTGFIPQELIFPISTSVSAIMVYDISLRSKNLAYFYRSIAIMGLVISMITNLIVYSNLLSALLVIFAGFTMALFALKIKQRYILIWGTVLIVSGMAHQLYFLIMHFDINSWVSLALLGILSIVIGSGIETRGEYFKSKVTTLKHRFSQWEK